MKSKIAELIKLKTSPVAVLYSDVKPAEAIQFQEGRWGCVTSMINAASKGKTAVFDEKTTGCNGGAVGLGFKKFEPGYIEYFLSTGAPDGREGEYYRQSPDYARGFVQSLPEAPVPTRYVVLKPLENLADHETPEVVIFLANADQISGLVTLANYDRPTSDNVGILAAAGCHQTILEVIAEARSANPRAMIGLTDASARVFLDKEVLSFSIPYKRFLEMESNAEESFLTKETWSKILPRI